jgi:hypothetical protein
MGAGDPATAFRRKQKYMKSGRKGDTENEKGRKEKGKRCTRENANII